MLEKLREEVKKRVVEKRFIHILGVEEKAVELGKKYGEDENKLRVAAILHDVAKNMRIDELERICREKFSTELTEKDLEIKEILHGFVGTIIAEEEFGIQDKDILDAIKYHTIGKKDLNRFGRIIYIADAIEKNRDYPGVEELRKIVDKNLDYGIIEEIDRKVKYLEKNNGKIHRNTLEMRDELLKNYFGDSRGGINENRERIGKDKRNI